MAEIDAVIQMIDFLGDIVSANMRRTLALQQILERAKLTTAEEVDAKMKAIEDAATLEIEFSDEHKEFRRMRAELRRLLGEPDVPPVAE
jgi:hypothetical protein